MVNFGTIINVVVGLINILGLFIWTFPLPFRLCSRLNTNDENYRDALQAAMSLGRLDGVSILLSIIGIMLGLLAIFGFGYIRHRSEKVAEKTAKETADSVMRSTIVQWAKNTRPQNDSEKFELAAIGPREVDFSAMEEEEEIGGEK